MKEREVNVGILTSHSPTSSIEELKKFSRRLIGDVTDELTGTTEMKWNFHIEEPSNLGDDNSRRPADFLGEASLRMVEGPFNIVLVITDHLPVNPFLRRAPKPVRRAQCGLQTLDAESAAVLEYLRYFPHGFKSSPYPVFARRVHFRSRRPEPRHSGREFPERV